MDVLILDDSKATLALLKRQLRALGHAVVGFSRAADLRYHMENHSADVLVTDMRMPDIDGVDLIKKVRVEQPELRIVAISADRGARLKVQAKAAGADFFLSKPILSNLLESALENKA